LEWERPCSKRKLEASRGPIEKTIVRNPHVTLAQGCVTLQPVHGRLNPVASAGRDRAEQSGRDSAGTIGDTAKGDPLPSAEKPPGESG